MNLGSGKDYKHDYLNVDVLDRVKPDLILDLSQEQIFPISCSSQLYGQMLLLENSFDVIVANDVLEHVSNLELLMGNALKLLAIGGRFLINVPYELSLGAWQDPTHLRAFNQNSWLYYTDWFWYLGWIEYRFDLTELTFNLSSLGKELLNTKKIGQDEVINTPRAIDSMKVVLTKRKTTLEEKTLARSYSNNLPIPITGVGII
jgi:SAM-dependent methyltransferase